MSFFFLSIRPPPRSPLFPYTTLFRSKSIASSPVRSRRSRTSPGASPRWRRSSRSVAPGEDRKSTRLNSSHEWISYAVFCLKKKKKEKQDYDRGHGEERYTMQEVSSRT